MTAQVEGGELDGQQVAGPRRAEEEEGMVRLEAGSARANRGGGHTLEEWQAGRAHIAALGNA